MPASETLLLLVGRGTSDPDANANIARVSRFLWESYGVGWASVAFSGLTAPSVDEALAVCRQAGLSSGSSSSPISCSTASSQADRRRRRADTPRPTVRSRSSPSLTSGLHPLLLQAFEDRAHEAVHGAPHMNCDLCKYRVRLIGREADLGAPQDGHHHHVRADVERTTTITAPAGPPGAATAARPPTTCPATRGTSACSVGSLRSTEREADLSMDQHESPTGDSSRSSGSGRATRSC